MSTFRHIPTFETLKSPSANSTVYDHPAKKPLESFGCLDFVAISLGFCWDFERSSPSSNVEASGVPATDRILISCLGALWTTSSELTTLHSVDKADLKGHAVQHGSAQENVEHFAFIIF